MLFKREKERGEPVARAHPAQSCSLPAHTCSLASEPKLSYKSKASVSVQRCSFNARSARREEALEFAAARWQPHLAAIPQEVVGASE